MDGVDSRCSSLKRMFTLSRQLLRANGFFEKSELVSLGDFCLGGKIWFDALIPNPQREFGCSRPGYRNQLVWVGVIMPRIGTLISGVNVLVVLITRCPVCQPSFASAF